MMTRDMQISKTNYVLKVYWAGFCCLAKRWASELEFVYSKQFSFIKAGIFNGKIFYKIELSNWSKSEKGNPKSAKNWISHCQSVILSLVRPFVILCIFSLCLPPFSNISVSPTDFMLAVPKPGYSSRHYYYYCVIFLPLSFEALNIIVTCLIFYLGVGWEGALCHFHSIIK